MLSFETHKSRINIDAFDSLGSVGVTYSNTESEAM